MIIRTIPNPVAEMAETMLDNPQSTRQVNPIQPAPMKKASIDSIENRQGLESHFVAVR